MLSMHSILAIFENFREENISKVVNFLAHVLGFDNYFDVI